MNKSMGLSEDPESRFKNYALKKAYLGRIPPRLGQGSGKREAARKKDTLSN